MTEFELEKQALFTDIRNSLSSLDTRGKIKKAFSSFEKLDFGKLSEFKLKYTSKFNFIAAVEENADRRFKQIWSVSVSCVLNELKWHYDSLQIAAFIQASIVSEKEYMKRIQNKGITWNYLEFKDVFTDLLILWINTYLLSITDELQRYQELLELKQIVLKEIDNKLL
jgi:hypothetical protein